MSKRAVQKKPLSKATITLNEQLSRRRGVRDLEMRFLIVCEDTKSSFNYFEALQTHFKLSAGSVKVAHSDHRTQPTQVVEHALALKMQSAHKDSGTEPFRHVWCVIDGDFGPAIKQARTLAKANGIELAISTMCFEYWILLHFEESETSRLDCNAVVRDVRRTHLPRYQKGACDFSAIVPRVRDACARAKKLRKPGIVRNDLPEYHNPCSEVYLLIEAIMGIQRL